MIKFFKKNILDQTNLLPSFAITDASATDTGTAYTILMRNRNNNSGWATTGSVDAGSTTMVVSFGETKSFSNILLVGHNFKNFNLKYLVGTTYTAFSTAIDYTNNTLSTVYADFSEVSTTAIQLKINGTMTANADKYLKQFIVTSILGTFSIEPEIKPQWDKDRKVTKYLSGKSYVAKAAGSFNVNIRMKTVYNEADLSLVETLFNMYGGFLVWPCGGDTSTMETIRQGYRLEDIFFMDVANEYQPEFNDSRWQMGMPIDLKLVEVS